MNEAEVYSQPLVNHNRPAERATQPPGGALAPLRRVQPLETRDFWFIETLKTTRDRERNSVPEIPQHLVTRDYEVIYARAREACARDACAHARFTRATRDPRPRSEVRFKNPKLGALLARKCVAYADEGSRTLGFSSKRLSTNFPSVVFEPGFRAWFSLEVCTELTFRAWSLVS